MKIIEFLKPGIVVQKNLNPVVWDSDSRIHADVKEKLLIIAQHFKEYVEVDFPIIDVIITGGQTGKYYTEQSDLDLHLVTDYDQIECDRELEELFQTKKTLYKKDFDISIKGIPVELYVEDKKTPAVGGAYSLVNDKWIRMSTSPKDPIDQELIDTQSEKLGKLIARAVVSNDLELLYKIKDFLQDYRRKGLKNQGEFGVANLVFKTLRNSGILDQLKIKIKRLESDKLGLK